MGIHDTLVDDSHLARTVVDGVVRAFREHHAASRYDHRPRWHVVGTERDHVGRTALILSHKHVLVLLSYQFRHGLRRVVKLGEHIRRSFILREPPGDELAPQVASKWLRRGQEHTAVADRIALHIVKIAVRVAFVVIVQAVTAQHLQKRLALHPLIRNIGQINTRCIALVFDIEPELGAFYPGGEIVHVLHHQPPVDLRGIVRSIFQCLHEEGLRSLGEIRGKLSHLIGDTTRCKFVGDSHHLISLESRLQRHVA